VRYESKVTVGLAIGCVALVMGVVKLGAIRYTHRAAELTARQEVVCPSFLSIARSARDTLIVMRNEPLCNRYVLDNLK
jgi:hypothetical protein